MREVTNFANEICGQIQTSGNRELTTANGELKAEVSGIVRKVLGNAGGTINGKHLSDAYENVLREDLAKELFNVRECRIKMVEVGREEVCPPHSEKQDNILEDNLAFSDIVGIYVGQSLNKTAYGKGKTMLDIQEVDRQSRKVKAYLIWSEGLYGEGSLYGTINDNVIELSGTMISGITGLWDCDLQGRYLRNKLIKGTYRVYPRPGNPNGTQAGEFLVSRP